MKDGRAYSQAMADDIRTYWMRKGYRVNVWVEEMALKDQTAKSKDAKIFWCIRSDMVNGLPQKRIFAAKRGT